MYDAHVLTAWAPRKTFTLPYSELTDDQGSGLAESVMEMCARALGTDKCQVLAYVDLFDLQMNDREQG